MSVQMDSQIGCSEVLPVVVTASMWVAELSESHIVKTAVDSPINNIDGFGFSMKTLLFGIPQI